ncbi:25_t:CDS:1 [Ambispora leptoticha]|uniref:25_t:CDS:1 n=1 Tax=Ambispora leptoticha TaxID=144679 RepID=A0A9N9BJ78_9GLOM|nr:25_t:CDS:1 [Ambispora leptoticha]
MMIRYSNIYIFALFFNFLFVSLFGVPTNYEIHAINVKTFANNDNFKISYADGRLKLSKSTEKISIINDNDSEQSDILLASNDYKNSIPEPHYSVYYQNNDDFIDLNFYDINHLKYESSCLLHYNQRFVSIKISSLEGKEFWPGDENFSLGNDPETLVEIHLRNCRFIVGAFNLLVTDPDNAFLKDFVMEYVKLGDSFTFYVRPGWKFEP